MKKMKKIAALLLAMVMIFAMGMTAAAAEITVDNAVEGETYNLYKLFDVSVAENATADSGYSYYLTKADYDVYGATLKAAGVTFTESADGSRYTVNVEDFDAAALAENLKDNVESLKKVASEEAEGTTVEFTDLDEGYYFLDSSLGSLCSLNTSGDGKVIVEKNSFPSIKKEVQEDSDSTWGEEATADITQIVNFRLTVNTGTNPAEGVPEGETGVDEDYVITDTLPPGMTFKEITGINGIAAEKVTDSYENDILTITLDGEAVEALGQDADIVIEYTASVESDAVIGGAGNKNTVTLRYKKQESSDEATVKTYEIGADDISGKGTITKVDATNGDAALAGVGFTLTNAEGKFAKVDGTVFNGWADDKVEILTDAEGEIHVKGLDAGEYTLTETSPKDGYNALDYTVSVTIAEDGAVTYLASNAASGTAPSGSIEIANSMGTILPSTGGIGTTIFYVVGGILVVGACVLLITKKRMGTRE